MGREQHIATGSWSLDPRSACNRCGRNCPRWLALLRIMAIGVYAGTTGGAPPVHADNLRFAIEDYNKTEECS